MKKNEIDDFLRFLVQTLPCKGYLEPLLTVLGKNLGWTNKGDLQLLMVQCLF